jgi:hypothetical protein
MKFKGLAVFSIALMAMVAAPQAARDFRSFVDCLSQTAHVAFIRAVLNSHESRNPESQVSAPAPERATICSNQPPAFAGTPRTKKPAASSARGASRVLRSLRSSTRQQNPAVELASMEIQGIKEIDPRILGLNEEARQRLIKLSKRNFVFSEDAKKSNGFEFVQTVIKSLRAAEKPKPIRELQRSSIPAIDVNPPSEPVPFIRVPPGPSMALKAVACPGLSEAEIASE